MARSRVTEEPTQARLVKGVPRGLRAEEVRWVVGVHRTVGPGKLLLEQVHKVGRPPEPTAFLPPPTFSSVPTPQLKDYFPAVSAVGADH